MTINLAAHAIDLQQRWNRMHVSPVHLHDLDAVAKRLFADKDTFVKASVLTHVPWHIVAVIKEREAGADPGFMRNIAQGDPWNRRSIHDPAGRGPFKGWEEAAYDALVNCHPYASKWKDWTIGGALCLLEQYNGLGYAMRGKPSPYIWSYSDQYTSGKFTRDHYYDPTVKDVQMGCAPMIARLVALDPSITMVPTPGVKH